MTEGEARIKQEKEKILTPFPGTANDSPWNNVEYEISGFQQRSSLKYFLHRGKILENLFVK